MSRVWSCRLGLIVAPAGSGKTTLLASFAAGAGVPVAWYRAEGWDGSMDAFLGHLEAALVTALRELPRGWSSVEDAARALEAWRGERALMVIDDLHTLEGSPAEQGLGRLLEYAPASITFLGASRTQPRLNLSRLRVSSGLVEISGEDLRFRSWEVERLFRDYYGDPLPPADLAQLARRTEGWAAGLQLFYLATRGKPPDERRRVLAGMATGSRFMREYLTRNVLDELPPELRSFLVETSVIGRLNGSICDQFLGRSGSLQLLEELERRQVFTQALDDDGHYRYHEVLRAHLEGVLVREVGEAVVRDRHRRAGGLLEESGALAEALHAYCRAGDWTAVDRLLGRSGAELVRNSGLWIDALPSSVLEHDPWLLLAGARRHRAEGHWRVAIETYLQAEHAFGDGEGMELARRERTSLAPWLNLGPPPARELLGALRRATQDAPLDARLSARGLGDPGGVLLVGLVSLLAGDVAGAREALAASAANPLAEGAMSVAALMGLGMAGWLAGDRSATSHLIAATERAESLGLGFLARLGRACVALHAGNAITEAATVHISCKRIGDEWGAAMAGLIAGFAATAFSDPRDLDQAAGLLAEAALWFERADARSLQAWARCLHALVAARIGRADSQTLAVQAERLALARGVQGAAVYAYHALAIADPGRRTEYAGMAASTEVATGLMVAACDDSASTRHDMTAISIRLLGRFEVAAQGVPLDLTCLKPRVRALLQLLAVHAGRPLHREVIADLLWPGADADAGARNLQVAMSSLRQTLEPGVARGAARVIVREGDAYRLVLSGDAQCDLATLDMQVAAGRRARSARDAQQAIDCYRRALESYGGELLPELGAAEWVVGPRERCQAAAADAAHSLAELLLDSGDATAAAQACATGLRIDRYHDPLWRLMIAAREQAGDLVAASRARADYKRVLADLGL